MGRGIELMTMHRTFCALALAGLFGLAGAGGLVPAIAQTPDEGAAASKSERAVDAAKNDDPGGELPAGFRPIRGKEESAKVDPDPLVVMAYGAILAGLFVYVIFMVREQGRLSKEIAELAREMERRDG